LKLLVAAYVEYAVGLSQNELASSAAHLPNQPGRHLDSTVLGARAPLLLKAEPAAPLRGQFMVTILAKPGESYLRD
jgi:hypothetical protein